ncbi:hypothetical protein MIR68_001751 [Amoeboaphelidium protococcarum]|nr:hypothetical protein MIR68_001751 [Amoeboaphelidium protococcarum]
MTLHFDSKMISIKVSPLCALRLLWFTSCSILISQLIWLYLYRDTRQFSTALTSRRNDIKLNFWPVYKPEHYKISDKLKQFHVVSFECVNPTQDGHNADNVLILTPMKDVNDTDLTSYLDILNSLTYPKHLISVGVLVSDSTDEVYHMVVKRMSSLCSTFARVTILRKDYSYRIEHSQRHDIQVQMQRRVILANSRNYLLHSSLRREQYVLWLDSDLLYVPETVIHDLLHLSLPIVTANCKQIRNNTNHSANSTYSILSHYDLNAWKYSNQRLPLRDEQILLQGYYQRDGVGCTREIHLNNFGQRRLSTGQSFKSLERSTSNTILLDAVGGSLLWVFADLHRNGLTFPTVPYRNTIETEGLGQIARSMGIPVIGLPNYIILHK